MQLHRSMVTGILSVLFIFLAMLKISAQERSKTVDLAVFLLPEKNNKDATAAVRNALQHCRAIHATRLVIPTGIYEFWPEEAAEQYLFTSNNDEGLKRITFLLEDMTDFEIDGQGSQFIFHGVVSPFVINRCKNIRLHHFSIDWKRTFHSEARILKAGGDSMELAITAAYPYKIVNNILVFYGEDNSTIYPYGGLLEFDPVKKETAYMAADYWTNSDITAREISPGHIKIYRPGITGTPGNILTFGAKDRVSSAITVSDSRRIKVDNATIFHCGGMGIVAQRSRDMTLDQIRVTPGNGRVVSATADATHFANCSGNITITHCLFENQLDDATNIHGIYVQVVKQVAANTLLLALKHPQQSGFDFIKPGMVMELVHSNNLINYGQAVVKSAERINKIYTQVVFKKALPAGLVVKDVMAGIADTPFVRIQHCTIRGNRARGILLGSRGKILITENVFHNAGAAILFEGDAMHWFEQAGVKNVSITGNTFDNCNYGVWGNAVIQVGSGIDAQGRKTSRYNSNILIEGNTFKVFDPRLINAYAVDRLVFRNNIVEQTNAYKSSFPAAKAFEIKDSEKVEIVL
jgi:Right handed beta helix region